MNDPHISIFESIQENLASRGLPAIEPDIELLISGTEQAVKKIGELGKEVWDRRSKEDFGGKHTKDDDSPVTGLDLFVSEEAEKHFPLFIPGPVLTEENIKDLDIAPEVLRAGRWLVDPIDGTKGLLQPPALPIEKAGWGISAAYVIEDRPVVGIIGIPRTGMVYFAIEGCGCYSYNAHTKSFNLEPFSSRTSVTTKESHTVGISSSFSDEQWAKTVELYESNGYEKDQLDKVSSVVKYAQMLEGKLDVIGAWREIHGWDIAAAVTLVRESGREFIDLETKAPVRLIPGEEDKAYQGVLALPTNLPFSY